MLPNFFYHKVTVLMWRDRFRTRFGPVPIFGTKNAPKFRLPESDRFKVEKSLRTRFGPVPLFGTENAPKLRLPDSDSFKVEKSLPDPI